MKSVFRGSLNVIPATKSAFRDLLIAEAYQILCLPQNLQVPKKITIHYPFYEILIPRQLLLYPKYYTDHENYILKLTNSNSLYLSRKIDLAETANA